jgi:uncharacterized membrane protein YhaH (DUF805 family)
MNFSEAIKSGFSKYATFTGRAARSEYWYWTLFTIVVSIVTGGLDAMLFPGIASGLLSLSRCGVCTIATAPVGGC